MEAACYPVAIVSNALTRRYRSLLFVALAVAYAAVLNVTVLMPSFLVTNVSLIGIDDIGIERLELRGFSENALILSGEYTLHVQMPATTAYDDLRLNFRYVVPGTPDVAALGDFSIPPFHILPGGESVNVVLDHFLYEYDPKALRRFYDYTQSPAYGAIVMLFDADVHGVMKPGLPITYHLNVAYRLKALVRVLKDWYARRQQARHTPPPSPRLVTS
ncbi:hypothetical protein JL722_12593 [Aureococcus anophagefferens]|nr:hypothetical protein JL722_12593 [Aureococcus anophagefferens]